MPRTLRPLRLGRPLATALAIVATSVAPARAAYAEAPSSSEASARHVVAIYIEGPKTADTRALVESALGERAQPVAFADLKGALTAQGQKLPLGITVTVGSKRTGMMARIGKALGELGAEAAVIGFVRPRREGGREVVLIVLEAHREAPSIEKTIALEQDSSASDVALALSDLTAGWSVAEPNAPAPTAPAEGATEPANVPGDEAEAARPENVYGREIVNVSLAFDLGGRFFSYHDIISDNLRDYSVFGAPGMAARLEVFPLASLGIVVLRDIGLTGEARLSPGLSSETTDGTVVDTQWMRFGGGLRYRIPVGPDDAPYVFGVRGGIARDAFTLETTGPLAAEVPGVAYTFLRGGLDARIPMGPVALTAFGGYLGALDAGPVYERFRDSVIGGIDVGGGLTVPIALGFEAVLAATYVRWFYAFAPVVGDAYVAGGALDENVHIEIGPQYVY